MDTYFTVTNEHLAGLSSSEAVARFRELLWAEARSLGIPLSKIHVSSRVTVADGGIDASVEENVAPNSSSLIKVGRTAYQIKTGTTFMPWQKSKVQEELFGNKEAKLENLAPSVRSCLDDGGTYVVVMFGQDPVEAQWENAVNNVQEYLKNCGYDDANVEVWGQNNLLSFIQSYPSLALRISRRQTGSFQTHYSWSQNEDMRKEFHAEDAQNTLITTLQGALRANSASVHVRLLGEPGVGKTKLALEATRADDLQPLILYLYGPAQFLGSSLMADILQDDNTYSSILVIDECDQGDAAVIWNLLKNRGARIKLITIYNDYDDAHHDNLLHAPPLNEDGIVSILRTYGIPADEAPRYVEFCSGSPRVAHILGENLQHNRDDILRSPGTVNLWTRYVAGREDPLSDQVRQRELVLQHIALFERFGYQKSLVEDAQAISVLIEKADHLITWSRFQQIVIQLVRRRILQGENILYITPRALHIKLWLDWWDTYSSALDVAALQRSLNTRLVSWFNDMFKYASGSAATLRITRHYLGSQGPFENSDYLETEQGADFFLALTQADPVSALRSLERIIGRKEQEELLQFTTGRRQIIHALEMIAVWKDQFADAAWLLLRLAEAENETWSNNATGVFAELFSSGYGPVAPTEASPQERFPVLVTAINSDSSAQRRIALRACSAALETRHFHRVIGREYQGLRRRPKLWMPETYSELFDAYRQVWQLLYEHLDVLPEDERQQISDILLQRTREIVRIAPLSDMVFETIREMAQKPWSDRKQVLQTVVQLLRYDNERMPEEIRQRWEQLKETLTGHDFHSLLQRYVGMHFTEDYYDEQGNFVGHNQIQIEKLAQQAVEHPDLLEAELPWLLSREAQLGHVFGHELGKMDRELSLLSILLAAQRHTGASSTNYLLGGYLTALFEKDAEKWEEILDALANDSSLRVRVPELTARSGVSDRAALRVLALAEQGIIEPRAFQSFSYWRNMQGLSKDIFEKWIALLLNSSDPNAGTIALNLYYTYYVIQNPASPMPDGSTFMLLIHVAVLQPPQIAQLDPHQWTELARRYVQFYPERSLDLARVMLVQLGNEGSIIRLSLPTMDVLTDLTRMQPDEMWQLMARYLEQFDQVSGFLVKEWLRGELSFGQEEEEGEEEADGPIKFMTPAKIWEWVEADIEHRAWIIATLVPKKLSIESGKVPLARELLVKYGEREDVRRNLLANFLSEGWTGSETLHLTKKKLTLVGMRQTEGNANVRRWIDEFLVYLEERIEDARLREELEGSL